MNDRVKDYIIKKAIAKSNVEIPNDQNEIAIIRSLLLSSINKFSDGDKNKPENPYHKVSDDVVNIPIILIENANK